MLSVSTGALFPIVHAASAGSTGSSATFDVQPTRDPNQIANAYGVSQLSNEGKGVTIAIVDEYHDPKIKSDANYFSSRYGLPALDGANGDPSLTVIEDKKYGPLAKSPTRSVALETSLDVEWAHAMAPLANIVLVEVPAGRTAQKSMRNLLHGVNLAAKQTGVVVVSLSYGFEQGVLSSSVVKSLNDTYLAKGTAASKVAVTAATGDHGIPSFPATSPDVIAVGGTALQITNRGTYQQEQAWGGSQEKGAGGGGLSIDFGAPSFQSSHGVSYGSRAVPDISAVAAQRSPLWVYSTLNVKSGLSAWAEESGTSVATPIIAGILALAQKGRIDAGKAILTSTEVDHLLYAAYDSANYDNLFHDITLGNNGDSSVKNEKAHPATVGYDLATGIGSPIANTLVPYLIKSS